MSRIYFHSPSDTEEIYGRERAWMGCFLEDLARGLTVSRFNCTDLARFLPKDAWPLNELNEANGSAVRFAGALELWMRGGAPSESWVVGGQRYDCWQMTLNTCMAVGNDATKLCARLHGQCEIHAYVEGPNRAWLAGVVREGIRCGLMRDGGNEKERGQWSRLADWLEQRKDEPVVTSYSVCEGFPNPGVAGNVDEDGWHATPPQSRWDTAMARLRENDGGLEIKPEDWAEYRFGHCKDAFWLWERARLDRNQT
jgi:hypothetical protein